MSQTFLIIVTLHSGLNEETIIETCEANGCQATRVYGTDEYRITTDDPVNFFWLGVSWKDVLYKYTVTAI